MKNLNEVICNQHSRSQPRYPRFEFCPECRKEAPHEAKVVEAVVNYFSPIFPDQFIETEHTVYMGSDKRRADVLFIFKDQNTMIIECKRQGFTYIDDGIGQLKSYLSPTDTPIGILAKSTDHNDWTVFENLGRNKIVEIKWEHFWTRIIEIEPDITIDYCERGFTKQNSDDYRGAIVDYDKAIEHTPDYAKPYLFRGFSKHQLGENEEAISDFDKVIELIPNSPYAYYFRGKVEFELGQCSRSFFAYCKTISDFDKVIELIPNSPFAYFAYYLRGRAKYELYEYNQFYEYEETIADFDKVIEHYPNFADAYHYRGVAKHDFGKYEESISDFNVAIGIESGNYTTYNSRGRSKIALGNYAEGIADYYEAIALNPNDAVAYICCGVAKVAITQYDEAIKDYDKALELDPNNKYIRILREIAVSLMEKLFPF